ncbi:Uncharacterised protein r2_g1334 [Pycnogonum litorale]
MGGVDLLNSLIALYRTPVRSKKWYHRIFFHLIDTVVVNCWSTYRRDAVKPIKLREFKARISEGLSLQKKTVKRGRRSNNVEVEYQLKKKRGNAASILDSSVRKDELGHWPSYETKGRCRVPNCAGLTQVKCEKCNVRLCFTAKRNCFKLFHTS